MIVVIVGVAEMAVSAGAWAAELGGIMVAADIVGDLVDGAVSGGEKMLMMATHSTAEVLEVGYFTPLLVSVGTLTSGEVGYIATGFKDVKDCRVGDTITTLAEPAKTWLGFRGSTASEITRPAIP